MSDRPTITLQELQKESARRLEDELQDVAIVAAAALKGLSRGDKLKVLRRMRKIVAG